MLGASSDGLDIQPRVLCQCFSDSHRVRAFRPNCSGRPPAPGSPERRFLRVRPASIQAEGEGASARNPRERCSTAASRRARALPNRDSAASAASRPGRRDGAPSSSAASLRISHPFRERPVADCASLLLDCAVGAADPIRWPGWNAARRVAGRCPRPFPPLHGYLPEAHDRPSPLRPRPAGPRRQAAAARGCRDRPKRQRRGAPLVRSVRRDRPGSGRRSPGGTICDPLREFTRTSPATWRPGASF